MPAIILPFPVSVKSFSEDGPVMLSSLEVRTKHLTITGPCPNHNLGETQRSPYGDVRNAREMVASKEASND